jgi:Zn-dependent peptidase ImmA (M78 family)
MGIIVGAMPQVDGGISAFSCWVARDPVILLKASDHGRRRARFDAAHELGHLLLHRNLAEDRAIERQADEFAAHLLLPPTELHSRLSAPFNWDEVVSTANHFDVSNAAVISGAHHAGAIGNRLYSAAMAEAAKRGWLRHNVPDSEPTELARDSVSKSRRLAS